MDAGLCAVPFARSEKEDLRDPGREPGHEGGGEDCSDEGGIVEAGESESELEEPALAHPSMVVPVPADVEREEGVAVLRGGCW
jgi:hypothetical protein